MSRKLENAQLLAMGLLAWALSSCGNGTPVNTTLAISNYQTSCTAPSDCIAVFIGNVCGCHCANAAISNADSARYQSEYHSAQQGCQQGLGCGVECVNTTVACTSNVCAIMY